MATNRRPYVRTRNAEQFRALEGRSVRRRDERRRHREEQKAEASRQRQHVLLSAVFGVLIFFVGVLPLLTTFRQYVASQSQVSDLRSQEQSLKRQKANLDEQIKRWDDDAYVIAQARTRLGFVYPGETSVRVIGAEKYAQDDKKDDSSSSADSVSQKNMPWNLLLRRSLLDSDAGTAKKSGSSGSSGSGSGSKSDSVQRDPSSTYTPVNGTLKNPYVLTDEERKQAQKEQEQKKSGGSTGTGTGGTTDLGGILGRAN